MEMTNAVLIRARPEAVLEAAYHVERWPELLPHYRWVKVLETRPSDRTVQMAARRGVIPLKWTALQWINREERRVYFRHVRGPTRGMEVFWEAEPLSGTETRVTIHHSLSYPVPILGPLAARYAAGALFIHPTANRTLRCFKVILERDRPG